MISLPSGRRMRQSASRTASRFRSARASGQLLGWVEGSLQRQEVIRSCRSLDFHAEHGGAVEAFRRLIHERDPARGVGGGDVVPDLF
jgi:hypothetical protein